MKFITFEKSVGLGFGGVVDDRVVDLTEDFISLHQTLVEGRLDEAMTAAKSGTPFADMSELTLASLAPEAEKYFCIGVNYQGRNAEYKDGQAPPEFPSVFMRSRESFTGHNRPLIRPPESHKLDYEGEIVIIIGKEGRRIKRENARNHIAGLSLMNEGTLRDWVRHAKFNVTQGKNFERSGAIGPWMVTMDEVGDLADLDITTHVNGELRQDDNTSSMAFSIAFIVEYLSKFARLKPGDVIATGTPNGAGARFDPPRFLVPGDEITINCPAIGTLRNTVEDERL